MSRAARVAACALLVLGEACGTSSAPAAPIAPSAPTPASPAPGPAPPTLPFELTYGAARPAPESPEGQLLARWAAAVRFDLDAEPRFYFRAVRTERSLLGATPILELSGHDDSSPRGDGGTLFVIDHDGVPGPALRTLLLEPITSITAEGEAQVEDTSWLGGIGACDETAPPPEASTDRDERLDPLLGCEDLVSQVASALLERASSGAPLDAVRTFLTELTRVASPASSLDLVERAADIPGTRAQRARFVPFAATLDDGALTAEGTLRLGATCSPAIHYARFRLRATETTIELTREAIATEILRTRCL